MSDPAPETGLTSLLAELRAELATLPWLARCYDHVPDAVNETPSIVVYPWEGAWRLSAHFTADGGSPLMGTHTIRIELQIARKDLERDMAMVERFINVLPLHIYRAFVRDRFRETLVTTGNVDAAGNTRPPLRYRVVEGKWGADQRIGHQLEFDVSIQQEVAA